MTRGRKWLDVRAGFEGFGLIGDDAVTAGDLAALLAELRRTLKPDAPAASAVEAAIDDCATVTTDAEAELVRKGFRLGQWLAVAERARFFRGQLGINRKAGQSTKRANLAARNAAMAKQYRKCEPKVGCLAARRKLSVDYKLTMKQTSAVLRAAGVALETRKSA